MKALIYAIAMILMAVSCKAQEIDQEAMDGTFYKLVKAKNFGKSYTLELNRDGSFKFMLKQLDAMPQCKGTWQIVVNEVLLECEEGDNPYEMLSNGYLSQREHTFLILNKNKLEYGDLVLKRTK
jgi:hypothetical protein